MSKGIVSEQDYLIIAVNGRRVPYIFLEDEIPYIVRAVLPFGDPYITIDIDDNQIINQGYYHRSKIKKISGSEVATKSFLNPEYSSISALLYSSADLWNFTQKPGREFIFLHNKLATKHLVKGWQKIGREFWVEDDRLERRII